ncbi:chemotaxis protein CheC, inhibitor of MCP methylation [Thermanaerovibrio velox DSM 12556]|uniref:Chemotaxis protein CheC, inhibitor of MCP methylation n=1 Tax=Thermanaerovibrio velox DSM 12556 TaxID=926567 RepID=H0UPY8_9BACT|nr:chemotaxis protein CheC [Thermanaerovibrio velox]EHM09617.1 chemotaxis protein CheC, inhibitor of MCP methylation [Thermanaerovibrio velox DSM 12556]
MSVDFDSFNSIQLDAIREVGNIGAGNAATALSKLLGRTVDMDVPVAELVSVYEVAQHYGSPEDLACGVLIRADGEFSCNLIFLMYEEEASALADLLISMDLSSMEEEVRLQIRDSALAEVGNIILGAFLNALSSMTGWALPVSVPAVAHDMLGSIMDVVAAMFGIMGDTALLVKTTLKIIDSDTEAKGMVIMVPDPGSLELLLQRLGVL